MGLKYGGKKGGALDFPLSVLFLDGHVFQACQKESQRMLPVVFGTARSAQVSRYFIKKEKDFLTVKHKILLKPLSIFCIKSCSGSSLSARHFFEGRCT